MIIENLRTKTNSNLQICAIHYKKIDFLTIKIPVTLLNDWFIKNSFEFVIALLTSIQGLVTSKRIYPS